MNINNKEKYWKELTRFVETTTVIIDRPKGSLHPKYGFKYPLDYGYLKNTSTMDGQGIDIWKGSLSGAGIYGILATLDPIKKDAEIKILLDVTEKEVKEIFELQNDGMAAMLIKNEK